MTYNNELKKGYVALRKMGLSHKSAEKAMNTAHLKASGKRRKKSKRRKASGFGMGWW